MWRRLFQATRDSGIPLRGRAGNSPSAVENLAARRPFSGCADLLVRIKRDAEKRRARALLHASLLCLVLLTGAVVAQEQARTLDPESGLIKDEAGVWQTTLDRCTECHSATLLQQNRTSRAGWIRTIRRMEKDEGLEPLGDLEEPILDYLAANYGVQVKPTELRRRRAPLRQPPVADGE